MRVFEKYMLPMVALIVKCNYYYSATFRLTDKHRHRQMPDKVTE